MTIFPSITGLRSFSKQSTGIIRSISVMRRYEGRQRQVAHGAVP